MQGVGIVGHQAQRFAVRGVGFLVLAGQGPQRAGAGKGARGRGLVALAQRQVGDVTQPLQRALAIARAELEIGQRLQRRDVHRIDAADAVELGARGLGVARVHEEDPRQLHAERELGRLSDLPGLSCLRRLSRLPGLSCLLPRLGRGVDAPAQQVGEVAPALALGVALDQRVRGLGVIGPPPRHPLVQPRGCGRVVRAHQARRRQRRAQRGIDVARGRGVVGQAFEVRRRRAVIALAHGHGGQRGQRGRGQGRALAVLARQGAALLEQRRIGRAHGQDALAEEGLGPAAAELVAVELHGLAIRVGYVGGGGAAGAQELVGALDAIQALDQGCGLGLGQDRALAVAGRAKADGQAAATHAERARADQTALRQAPARRGQEAPQQRGQGLDREAAEAVDRHAIVWHALGWRPTGRSCAWAAWAGSIRGRLAVSGDGPRPAAFARAPSDRGIHCIEQRRDDAVGQARRRLGQEAVHARPADQHAQRGARGHQVQTEADLGRVLAGLHAHVTRDRDVTVARLQGEVLDADRGQRLAAQRDQPGESLRRHLHARVAHPRPPVLEALDRGLGRGRLHQPGDLQRQLVRRPASRSARVWPS